MTVIEQPQRSKGVQLTGNLFETDFLADRSQENNERAPDSSPA